MVPSAFVTLAKLPLHPNGKLDRRALPAPDWSTAAGADYLAPRTPVEQALTEIWAEVLGVQRVGVEDNFFALGGDSVLSIQVVARAARAGLGMRSGDIFRHQTVALLAPNVTAALPEPVEQRPVTGTPPALVDQATLDRLAGDGRGVEDVYPLTPTQAGMVFHGLSQLKQGVYFQQAAFVVEGVADPRQLGAAFQHVVDRTPVLRSSVVFSGVAEPVQVVHREVVLPISYLDWALLSGTARQEQLRKWLEADRATGLDLAKAPLLRVMVAQLPGTEVQVVWTFHHVLLDGWSVFQVLSDVFGCHAQLRRSGPETAPADLAVPTRRPFRDYLQWLHAADRRQPEQYWRRVLAGLSEPTALPYDHQPEQAHRAESSAMIRVALDSEQSSRLHRATRQYGLTVNTVLQGAWALLLSRYSRQRDVVFGATVSGRPAELAGVDTMAGMFINTVPVRVHIDDGKNVLSWLRELQAEQTESRGSDIFGLARLQSFSELPAEVNLFDSIVVFENYPVSIANAATQGLRLRELTAIETTNYPLCVVVTPNEGLTIGLGYDPGLFMEPTIARMVNHLVHLLNVLVENPTVALERIDTFPEEDRHRVLADRRAFPAPEFDAGPSHCYAAPRNDTERVLAEIWADSLSVDKVGVEDNFFELGGDSIRSLLVTTRINEVFDVTLTPRDVLTARTVSALAEMVEGAILRELERVAFGDGNKDPR
jgi:acyl carrier protein